MLVLGLEGSANKLGVGLVNEKGEVLANCRHTYNAPTGQGFLPAEVIAHHRSRILDLVARAYEEAGKKYSETTHVAYTRGPGMGGPLASVALVARTLAQVWKVPLVPVNHCVAHVEMGRLVSGFDNPVILYASGGNTQVLAFSEGRYRVFGETLDIAVGNCLDRIARECGIPNDPSPGQNIETYAARWHSAHADESGFAPIIPKLPVAIKGMDVSCSGLASYVTALLREEPGIDLDYLCYSVQETLFAAMVEITERAAALVGAKDVLVVGGVGCNVRLQEMLQIMARERGGRLAGMSDMYCVDNGAMIAWTAVLMASASSPEIIPWEEVERGVVRQRYRTDAVEVTWRK